MTTTPRQLIRRVAIACSLILAWSNLARTEPVAFNVKARFSRSPTDIRLIEKDAVLILDDSAQKLVVKSKEHPLDVDFDHVDKVVFDVTTHMRGGSLGTALFGIAGAAIAAKHVNDYWCYVEYRSADGGVVPYMLEIPQETSSAVIESFKVAFGSKVSVAEFTEQAQAIPKETLKDLPSKHDVNVDEKNHPMPERRADKALVVVVCPALEPKVQGKGNQVKLHANDRVVAVNRMGTYTFAYLDPGDYLLVSQADNASGLRMTLQAGAEYYFMQDTFMGAWKSGTGLSRHSKELVMYEIGGAYYADWKAK